MPIASRIDSSRDLTLFTVKGLLNYDEVMRAATVFYEGEPTKHVLCDLLQITESLFTLEQAEKIVKFQPRFEGKRKSGKTAIVVQDQFLYGISNVLGMENNLLEAPYTVMVFGSKETAFKWIDEP